jgi:hypothetical protein
MTKTLVEILLFGSLVTNVTLLTFFAGVLRKVMNDMDEPTFKQFLDSLVGYSKKSPFMWVVFNIPFLGAIPYFYFYGFANRWLLAGLVLWLVAGGIAKTVKYPIYTAVAALKVGQVAGLSEERKKMNALNVFQAILNLVASVLALVPFVK